MSDRETATVITRLSRWQRPDCTVRDNKRALIDRSDAGQFIYYRCIDTDGRSTPGRLPRVMVAI
jgi:hypothetical protein